MIACQGMPALGAIPNGGAWIMTANPDLFLQSLAVLAAVALFAILLLGATKE